MPRRRPKSWLTFSANAVCMSESCLRLPTNDRAFSFPAASSGMVITVMWGVVSSRWITADSTLSAPCLALIQSSALPKYASCSFRPIWAIRSGLPPTKYSSPWTALLRIFSGARSCQRAITSRELSAPTSTRLSTSRTGSAFGVSRSRKVCCRLAPKLPRVLILAVRKIP